MTGASTGEGGPGTSKSSDPTAMRSIGEMVTQLRERSWIKLGLVVAMFGPFLATLFAGAIVAVASLPEIGNLLLMVIFVPWFVTAVLVGIVRFLERRSIASIGAVQPTRSDLWIGVAGAAVGLLTMLVTIPLGETLGITSNEGTLEMIVGLPLWAVTLLSVTAGVTEEVLFRGYPIERLTEVTGSVAVAGTITLAVFMLVHVPMWGIGHLITISGVSVVLTIMYAWYRRLAPVVIAHFLFNFVSFAVLPALGWL